MSDITTTIDSVKERIKKFGDEREWAQFHTPKNLSMGLAAEAAELLEIFQWINSEESRKEVENKREAVEQELADIALYVMQFCARYTIDLSMAIDKKMKINEAKYPVDKAKGRWHKYTDL